VKHHLIATAILALVTTPSAWSQKAPTNSSVLPGGLLVYGTVGTAGAGLGLGTQVANKWNVRAEVTSNSTTVNETNEDLKVQAKLNLESAGIYGDYFPFAGTFRVTGGVMFKSPNGSVTASPTTGETATIGDETYNFGVNDSLSGTVKYPSTMPYLGIGWGFGQLKEKGFKFGFDLGAGFGSLKSKLSPSDGLKTTAATAGLDITADLAAEEKKLNDKLNKVSFFPVVKVSVGYTF
jgi:hypothetical protein